MLHLKIHHNNPFFFGVIGLNLLLVLGLVLLASLFVTSFSSKANSACGLLNLTSENEDVRININDLAYFLIIHISMLGLKMAMLKSELMIRSMR